MTALAMVLWATTALTNPEAWDCSTCEHWKPLHWQYGMIQPWVRFCEWDCPIYREPTCYPKGWQHWKWPAKDHHGGYASHPPSTCKDQRGEKCCLMADRECWEPPYRHAKDLFTTACHFITARINGDSWLFWSTWNNMAWWLLPHWVQNHYACLFGYWSGSYMRCNRSTIFHHFADRLSAIGWRKGENDEMGPQ